MEGRALSSISLGPAFLRTHRIPRRRSNFAEYLLSNEAQRYFANETFEYPLVELINTHPLIEPLSDVHTPDIDLSQLDDLEGTLALLHEVGAL